MADPDKDKKPAPQGNNTENRDAAPASDMSPTKEGPIDFAALDLAYENAAVAQGGVMNRRAIGVREVLGNLNEADSPSLADELLKTLAIAALGAASGYVTTAITAKVVGEAAATLVAAVQSGLDDGLKDAATKVAGKLASVDGQSKATFFASQEEGLESLRESSLRRLNLEKKNAKDAVKAAAPGEQAKVMATKVQAAEGFDSAAGKSSETARQVQYETSLARWMNAMSQGKLGTASDELNGGTDLGKSVGMSPTDHYKQQGAEGVIYVAFGMHPAARPFRVNGERGTIKVAGMTSAARDRIKSTPIKNLGMPIVASGYIYDGFFDGISVSAGDNEVAFGKNESGTVWSKGHDDAMAGLRKAGNKDNANDAARVLIDEDIGNATLEHASV
jgi:hypothetical protein